MVSSNKADLDLRENFPLSREYLAYLELRNPDGARTANESNGYSEFPKRLSRLVIIFYQSKDRNKTPVYLVSIRDSAKSGLGRTDNRHLNYLVESILMNVGDSQRNVKKSSPSMSVMRVGVTIVVGTRESRVHGEGLQFVGIF